MLFAVAVTLLILGGCTYLFALLLNWDVLGDPEVRVRKDVETRLWVAWSKSLGGEMNWEARQ